MVQPNPPASSREFDDDFGCDERLFHYTSAEGLYGILKSDCLWATHFRFLNDSNEFIAAKKSLTNFVEVEIRKKIAALKVSGTITLKDGVTIRAISEHEADVIIEAMYTVTLKNYAPFVFSSFVSDPSSSDFQNGRLLHWATYGKCGGYAIQINPHKLARLIWGKQENLLSQKAIYVGAAIPPELANDYAEIGRAAQEMIVGTLQDQLEQVDLTKAAPSFLRVASTIKDDFFESEKEAENRLAQNERGDGWLFSSTCFHQTWHGSDNSLHQIVRWEATRRTEPNRGNNSWSPSGSGAQVGSSITLFGCEGAGRH